jgi:uncharacterized protein (UPF0276 family)
LKRSARTGILHSAAFAPWLEQSQRCIECIEVQASRFYSISSRLVESICHLRPTVISKGWLSLGTPGPLDVNRLSSFASLVERAKPLWISEPLGFSRTHEFGWETNLPVCPGPGSLNTIAEHSIQVMDVCQKLLLLETTASLIQARGSIRAADFVCQKANCGLLLDVTALLVNALNHGFDPVEWLHQVDRGFILQLHVSGYSRRDNRFFDEHLSAVQEDVWNLVEEVLGYCRPRAIVIEREGNYPPIFAIERELVRLKQLSRRVFPEIHE